MIQLYRSSLLKLVSSLVNCPSSYLKYPLKITPSILSSKLRHLSLSSSLSSSESSKGCKFEAVQLASRSLVKLQGPDTLPFLQGLITNDITHFENRPSIYTLFLNTQGRVLWDSILYQVKSEDNVTFVECDSTIKSNLIKHLKIYKLRKKVDIIDASEGPDGIDLWVVFDHGHVALTKEQLKEECCGPVLQQTSKRQDLPLSIDASLHSFGDPRLNELGWRIFLPKGAQFPPQDLQISPETSYKKLRYSLGVAEGVQELPAGACLPLESNGDYLHGVSFHKGCYIGQELTARSHHTGVIRKRIMPFRLQEENKNLENIDPSKLSLFSPSSNRSLGKIRGICGTYGIGLIRIEEALSAPELQIQDIDKVKVSLEKPFWWPIEASKEKLTRQ